MSCTGLWRERERDVKNSIASSKGERWQQCFWPGKCKTILKGFLLVAFNNLGKNFLLLLFFYCFRIMCNNRYLAIESWKMVFSWLLVKDWCLFLIKWDWSCLAAFPSNGTEIDFVTPSLGISSGLKRFLTLIGRVIADVARWGISLLRQWYLARDRRWIDRGCPWAGSWSCSRRCFL